MAVLYDIQFAFDSFCNWCSNRQANLHCAPLAQALSTVLKETTSGEAVTSKSLNARSHCAAFEYALRIAFVHISSGRIPVIELRAWIQKWRVRGPISPPRNGLRRYRTQRSAVPSPLERSVCNHWAQFAHFGTDVVTIALAPSGAR